MTGQRDFIEMLTSTLESLNIPYMLAGSVCSGFHGEPRATNGVDVVIGCSEDQLMAFVDEVAGRCYVDRTAARQAFRQRLMFNVIDLETGWKADLILLKDRPFSREEFRRRAIVSILGLSLYVASPEDTILSKLEWSRESGSDRQYRDALGVAALQWDRLDRAYLRHWGDVLGVGNAIRKLVIDAEGLQPGKA